MAVGWGAGATVAVGWATALVGVAAAGAVVATGADGAFVGVLNGIRDWNEYQNEVARLLTGPAQPKPIGIPVRAASTQGACA